MDDDNNLAPSMEPGKSLFQARTKAGLGMAEVCRRLRLSADQVEALENNWFHKLPESTYVKGYLQNYARLLNLDVQPILAAYTRHHAAARAVEMTTNLNRNDQIHHNEDTIKLALIVAVVVIIGLTIAWWQLSDDDVAPEKDEAGVAGGVIMENDRFPQLGDNQEFIGKEEVGGDQVFGSFPADPVQPPKQPEQPAAMGGVQSMPVPQVRPLESGPALSAAGAGRLGADAAGEAAQATRHGRARLVLQANEDTWVDIRDARQNKLLYETVPAGRMVNLEGDMPFSIFIGNVNGVKLFLNDEEYDVSQHKRGQVARFKLSESASATQ